MTAVAIVQARMGSTRLVGKVLATVGGMPMLELMLRRLETAPVDHVIVATSHLKRDDAVVEVARQCGVRVVRGSESDVLARFIAVTERYPADEVVRLTGDCPLVDAALIAEALDVHRSECADYTSNTLVRTFPDGLDVEVVAMAALRAAAVEARDPAEREHVTPFVYRRPERFRLSAFRNDEFLGDERWTVDTPADLQWLRDVVTMFDRIDFSWRDVLSARPPARADSSPVARLVPAPHSTPSCRVWHLERGGNVLGEVVLRVKHGVGRASLDVPSTLQPEIEDLLRERLAADAQVKELLVRSGPS